jgi:hypothetical protein
MEEQQDRGQAPELTSGSESRWKAGLWLIPMAPPRPPPSGTEHGCNGQQPLSLGGIPLGIFALKLVATNAATQASNVETPFAPISFIPLPLDGSISARKDVQGSNGRCARRYLGTGGANVIRQAGRPPWMPCGWREGRCHCEKRPTSDDWKFHPFEVRHGKGSK